jgi:hypothetical protein
MDAYAECLRRALLNAKHLKSKGFDWSQGCLYDIVQIQKNVKIITPRCTHPLFKPDTHQHYIKGFREAYDKFKDTMWAVVFQNLLFEYITDHKRVRVLDVGCGDSRHFQAMCKGIDPDKIIQYTTIDKKSRSGDHIEGDIFALTPDELQKYGGEYDVVIMDIEPHGKELEVYDRVYPLLSTEHVVICKCVGFIDLYGPSLANRFLKELQQNMGILYTFFGVCELNYLTRDVVAIVNKNGCTCNGNMLGYYDKDDPISFQFDDDGLLRYMLCAD